jgi:transposase-like protein|mmetsp:Transcript_17005/g.22023  ORF Transcript_17005/g.22023 Transcript_17005/m.22023 type:complete len:102 (+) Transcript_17005:105-410(+)
MRKFRSPEQWQQILEDQRQSGLTISEFCREHKISTSGFFTQRKKRQSSTAFVSAKVTQQTSTEVFRHEHQHIVLELSVGRLTLPTGTSAEYLTILLNGLQA